ncbi:MAG TPA: segregation/condensation protein A [Clostridia bacterium]|nr:segregation/condensation protein A [Clostridia bacterium]
MSYHVKLEIFEGPLDLLLHLIEKQEIDIYDIPIAKITDQYLSYLKAMEELDLTVASEFVVMGATLLSIKAKMLLPRPPVSQDSSEPLRDPREELVVKLVEYQKYKRAVEELHKRELENQKRYTHPFDLSSFLAGFPPINPLHNVSPWDLLEMYKKALEAAASPPPVHEVLQETATVSSQMKTILELLYQHPAGLEFGDLLSPRPSRALIVVTFLALLELLKTGQVDVYQTVNFGRIRILPRVQSAGGGQENVV